MVEGPTLYELPYFVSSKIFVTRVFLRLRNHTFNGYISGLEQDRDNLKQLLPTKSHIPYRLVPLPSRSRDHTTSGLAFLAFRSYTNRRKRGLGDVRDGIRGNNTTLPPGAGSSHPKVDWNIWRVQFNCLALYCCVVEWGRRQKRGGGSPQKL